MYTLGFSLFLPLGFLHYGNKCLLKSKIFSVGGGFYQIATEISNELDANEFKVITSFIDEDVEITPSSNATRYP
ncbi:MAG: hypothetical protein ACPGLV_18035, partial [Bacteroidia bacterium]